jgi:hypothetical protein
LVRRGRRRRLLRQTARSDGHGGEPSCTKWTLLQTENRVAYNRRHGRECGSLNPTGLRRRIRERAGCYCAGAIARMHLSKPRARSILL